MKKKFFLLPGVLCMAASLCLNTGRIPVMAAAPDSNGAGNTASTAPAGATNNTKQEEKQEIPESYNWEIQSNKIPGWPEGPKVVAETAILMDVNSGEILYAKGIDEKRAPASTTKIMTAMLALEKVPFETQITFTNEVNNIEPGSSHIGIKPGETLTMKDCAYAILLASANEVSSGVAEYIGGTVPKFVEEMNQRAKDLGCKNTHFVNANGLYSEDHYTTARDLALIAQAAFQSETFREIIKTPYYIVPKTNITNEERWLNNHHKMVLDGSEHYDGCLGGKTGYTEKAGNTLVTYAERNGTTLVCVVLADNVSHYADTRALLDYGFQNFQKLTAENTSLAPAENDDFGAYLKENGLLNTVIDHSSMNIPANAKESLTYKVNLEKNTVNIDYYYGETALGSSVQEASSEILQAADTFHLQERQAQQSAAANPKADSENTASSQSAAKPEKTSSLDGFWGEVLNIFHELPSWKYPALFLLAAAFIFYIVTLIVKIKRSLRRRKRRKIKKPKKGKQQ